MASHGQLPVVIFHNILQILLCESLYRTLYIFGCPADAAFAALAPDMVYHQIVHTVLDQQFYPRMQTVQVHIVYRVQRIADPEFIFVIMVQVVPFPALEQILVRRVLYGSHQRADVHPVMAFYMVVICKIGLPECAIPDVLYKFSYVTTAPFPVFVFCLKIMALLPHRLVPHTEQVPFRFFKRVFHNVGRIIPIFAVNLYPAKHYRIRLNLRLIKHGNADRPIQLAHVHTPLMIDIERVTAFRACLFFPCFDIFPPL